MGVKKLLKKFYYETSLCELSDIHKKDIDQNISHNSSLYLDIIYYTPNCTSTVLANKLHISKSAVTAKINELIQHDLILKIQSNTDKRVYFLEVSKKYKDMCSIWEQAFSKTEEHFKSSFTKEEREKFINIMEALINVYMEELSYGEHWK